MRDASDLKALQKARSPALNDLSHETRTSVAHHQVDVFLFEPDPRSLEPGMVLLFDRARSTGPPSLDRWRDDAPF